MSDKKTYQQEEQIRRYLQQEMTGTERNAFERKMQKDPFLADAVDGLSAFSSKEILSDIQSLKAEVQKGRPSNRRYIWYAAASVLVIVISTFILFNPEEKTNLTLTENTQKVEPKVISEITPQTQNQEQNATEQKKVPVNKQESSEIKFTETKLVPKATSNTKSGYSPNLDKQMKMKKSFALKENIKMEKIGRQQVVTQQLLNRDVPEEEKPMMKSGQEKEEAVVPERLAMSVKSPDQGTNILKTISGEVTDSSGRPIPGVTVLIKGTNKGTITDQNGKYSCNDVPDSSFLVFSFVGMKSQEIPLENKVQMDISLKEENLALSEVVVVGYGIQKKSSLTGAVSSVKSMQVIDGKASPVDGWEAFDEYLKAELSTPETGKPGEKIIVRLSFVITETGEKEQYQILKGKDETYTKEAIRIVRDGPAWMPEVREKTPRRSTVKLKLVFNP